MKLAYIIQTYKNESQIYKLIQVIKETSPQSFILLIHNPIHFKISERIERLYKNIHVIYVPVLLGGFSMMKNYFNGISWLLKNKIEFDWLINLTGQDYPTQPLSQIEKFLERTKYDGFLQYFKVLANSSPWGAAEGYKRYFYQYWRSPGYLSNWQQTMFKPIKFLVNNPRSIIQLETSYAVMIGIKSNWHPFDNNNLICYGGSFFMTLSKKCVIFLNQWYNLNQDNRLLNYYKKTFVPDESLIQTILVNSRFFKLSNNNHRYIDFSNSRYGHPRILTSQDYPSLINDDIHFARKFDINQDSKIFTMLDRRIFSRGRHQARIKDCRISN